MRSGWRALLTLSLAIAWASIACGGGSSTKDGGPRTEPTVEAPETTAAGDSPTTLPPGATPGLDDYNGDGEPDPTCGTQDFGAGLVLRIPCHITTSNTPENGTILVPNSLYRLPGSTDIDLSGISGQLVLARDDAGRRVMIFVFNSGALFETGSDAIGSVDTLDATIRLINRSAPRSAIQVRGHTDSVGSPSVNQGLSERRAAAVRDYLREHGTNAASTTSVGLGSTQPLALERNPDGSDSEDGRRFNRRVEIVVRLPG